MRIRRLSMEVASGRRNLEALRVLGERLEQHVRCEERERFPLIEQAVPENELVRLMALLGGEQKVR